MVMAYALRRSAVALHTVGPERTLESVGRETLKTRKETMSSGQAIMRQDLLC